MSYLEDVAKEVHMKYYSRGDFGQDSKEIKEICKITGVSKKEAKEAINEIKHPKGFQYRDDPNLETLNMIEGMFNRDRTAHCPRCGSTSITYQRKLSVGRGIMGGLLGASLGPSGETAGIVLGGMTGKKGYGVCLNCRKRWKI